MQTPDPRQENPTLGRRLAVSWDFPRSLFAKDLQLIVIVRFWDNTEETIVQPITRRRDFAVFFFPAASPDEKRILTYQVRAISAEGEVVGKWEHPLWTPLIEVGLSNTTYQK